jgi:hypothetical protein
MPLLYHTLAQITTNTNLERHAALHTVCQSPQVAKVPSMWATCEFTKRITVFWVVTLRHCVWVVHSISRNARNLARMTQCHILIPVGISQLTNSQVLKSPFCINHIGVFTPYHYLANLTDYSAPEQPLLKANCHIIPDAVQIELPAKVMLPHLCKLPKHLTNVIPTCLLDTCIMHALTLWYSINSCDQKFRQLFQYRHYLAYATVQKSGFSIHTVNLIHTEYTKGTVHLHYKWQNHAIFSTDVTTIKQ